MAEGGSEYQLTSARIKQLLRSRAEHSQEQQREQREHVERENAAAAAPSSSRTRGRAASPRSSAFVKCPICGTPMMQRTLDLHYTQCYNAQLRANDRSASQAAEQFNYSSAPPHHNDNDDVGDRAPHSAAGSTRFESRRSQSSHATPTPASGSRDVINAMRRPRALNSMTVGYRPEDVPPPSLAQLRSRSEGRSLRHEPLGTYSRTHSSSSAVKPSTSGSSHVHYHNPSRTHLRDDREMQDAVFEIQKRSKQQQQQQQQQQVASPGSSSRGRTRHTRHAKGSGGDTDSGDAVDTSAYSNTDDVAMRLDHLQRLNQMELEAHRTRSNSRGALRRRRQQSGQTSETNSDSEQVLAPTTVTATPRPAERRRLYKEEDDDDEDIVAVENQPASASSPPPPAPVVTAQPARNDDGYAEVRAQIEELKEVIALSTNKRSSSNNHRAAAMDEEEEEVYREAPPTSRGAATLAYAHRPHYGRSVQPPADILSDQEGSEDEPRLRLDSTRAPPPRDDSENDDVDEEPRTAVPLPQAGSSNSRSPSARHSRVANNDDIFLSQQPTYMRFVQRPTNAAAREERIEVIPEPLQRSPSPVDRASHIVTSELSYIDAEPPSRRVNNYVVHPTATSRSGSRSNSQNAVMAPTRTSTSRDRNGYETASLLPPPHEHNDITTAVHPNLLAARHRSNASKSPSRRLEVIAGLRDANSATVNMPPPSSRSVSTSQPINQERSRSTTSRSASVLLNNENSNGGTTIRSTSIGKRSSSSAMVQDDSRGRSSTRPIPRLHELVTVSSAPPPSVSPRPARSRSEAARQSSILDSPAPAPRRATPKDTPPPAEAKKESVEETAPPTTSASNNTEKVDDPPASASSKPTEQQESQPAKSTTKKEPEDQKEKEEPPQPVQKQEESSKPAAEAPPASSTSSSTSAPPPKFCWSCGAAYPAGVVAKFCCQCGAKALSA